MVRGTNRAVLGAGASSVESGYSAAMFCCGGCAGNERLDVGEAIPPDVGGGTGGFEQRMLSSPDINRFLLNLPRGNILLLPLVLVVGLPLPGYRTRVTLLLTSQKGQVGPLTASTYHIQPLYHFCIEAILQEVFPTLTQGLELGRNC